VQQQALLAHAHAQLGRIAQPMGGVFDILAAC
jgi:hypothetical protein